MTTPVLDVRELARLMRRHAALASRDVGPGCEDDEEDAVLLGKLLLLDELANRMEGEEMSAGETVELREAAHEAGRAVEVLTGRIVAASKEAGGVSEAAGEIHLTESEGVGSR